jgi:hypothetical protein
MFYTRCYVALIIMGWMIKINKDKYRVWSTVIDKYITDDMTKDELIRFLFWLRFEKLMDGMLEDMICFPKGWTDKKTGKYLNCEDEKHDEYFNVLKNRGEKFNQFFTKIKEAGITINLKDIDGVDISTDA